MVLSDQIKEISQRFFPDKKGIKFIQISGGLINSTFKVTFDDGESFIFQALNNSIFKEPYAIMNNIEQIAIHLEKSNYSLQVLKPIFSQNGFLEKDSSGFLWRVFPFIKASSVTNKVQNGEQAFEAAKAFGLFVKYLEGINLQLIEETIPDFHNLGFRLGHLDLALKNCSLNRKVKAEKEIESILEFRNQLSFDFKEMPLRIVHNDTKISNILFDENGKKSVCVIDLDTVMPGYSVFDFGDMIRTMCCTVSEEDKEIDRVEVDIEIFKLVTKGFIMATKSILTTVEKNNLVNGGIYIIYEQAIRFLTDFLNDDIYYSIEYPDHNLFRTKNQLKLLQSLISQKDDFELITSELY